MKAIRTEIESRVQQVAVLQDEIKVLQTAESLLAGSARCADRTPQRGVPTTPAKRKYTKRSGPPAAPVAIPPKGGGVSVSATKLDKPDTVAGAIKFLLRDEPVGAQFTGGELRANLLDDPDYKKLLETETGAKSMSNALFNWTNGGKFKKEGSGDEATYTITAAGKEWFAA